MKKLKTDVVVIGGGAAGLMAAAAAASNGAKVIVVERNKFVARKLGITGKGRCNVTNHCTAKEVMANVTTNPRFLLRCLNAFGPADTMAYFEQLGVPLKTERGKRVFPQSDRAADIVNALRRACMDAGVRIHTGRVTALNIVEGTVIGVEAEDTSIDCRAAIICTGGLSYPVTGSTGDGYTLARSAGHTVTDCCASLVPLESDDPVCHDLTGLSLRNVTLTITDDNGRKLFNELGEMLFTHFGLSGPLVLSASAHMRNYGENSFTAHIDLKPGLSHEMLDARILRDFAKFNGKELSNGLTELLHKRAIPYVLKKAGVDGSVKVAEVTKKMRRAIVETIKDFSIAITGPRPIAEAIITSGGVEVKEISPATMQSKLTGGLFFAGEVIDVDAYTGGYNLQIAWSTGRCAGINAAKFVLEEVSE